MDFVDYLMMAVLVGIIIAGNHYASKQKKSVADFLSANRYNSLSASYLAALSPPPPCPLLCPALPLLSVSLCMPCLCSSLLAPPTLPLAILSANRYSIRAIHQLQPGRKRRYVDEENELRWGGGGIAGRRRRVSCCVVGVLPRKQPAPSRAVLHLAAGTNPLSSPPQPNPLPLSALSATVFGASAAATVGTRRLCPAQPRTAAPLTAAARTGPSGSTYWRSGR